MIRKLIGGSIAAFSIGMVTLAEHRADYWKPILERVSARSGNSGVSSVRVLPLKGCGMSFGETIYAKNRIGGVPSDVTICRSRHGVRVDITTYESRWLRKAMP